MILRIADVSDDKTPPPLRLVLSCELGLWRRVSASVSRISPLFTPYLLKPKVPFKLGLGLVFSYVHTVR